MGGWGVVLIDLSKLLSVKTPHQTRIHVSLSLNTIESLFDLAKYRFWSGEAIPGVRRPVFIRQGQRQVPNLNLAAPFLIVGQVQVRLGLRHYFSCPRLG